MIDLGFGVSDPSFPISGLSKSYIGNVLMTNIGQLPFSTLYFSYNGAFTMLSAAHEWSHFAHRPKGLRVSSKPFGQQRSTYFLTLPYRYAIPLLVFFGTMHWFLPRSIFFGVEAYDKDGKREPSSAITSSGYSPNAILAVLLKLPPMTLFLLPTFMRKSKIAVPPVGASRARIAAACRLPSLDRMTRSSTIVVAIGEGY